LLLPAAIKSFTMTVNDSKHGAHQAEVKVDSDTPSVALDAPTFLSGKVVDEDGQPVVGAGVMLMEEPHRTVSTAADGTFRVARGKGQPWMFPEGESILHVYPPADSDFLFQAHEWKWPNDGIGDAELTLRLERGVMIEGRVVESGSGRPVVAAAVQWEPQEENNPHFKDSLKSRFTGADMRYETDAEGRFRMPVTPGPGYLRVEGPTRDYVKAPTTMGDQFYGEPGLQREYYDGLKRLELAVGETPAPVTIELKRGETLRRQVVRPDGKPANGVAHAASYLGDKYYINGHVPSLPIVDGQFELPGFDPQRSTPVFLLDADGKFGAVVSTEPGHVAPDDSTVELQPCGSAQFRFVDDAGKPLADFQPPLHLVFQEGAPATHHIEPDQPLWSDTIIWDNVIRPRETPKTDADGRVVVDGLIPGGSYNVYYPSKEGGWTEGYPFVVRSGETTDVGEVVLPRQGL
jgi:hypothetical protein